MRIFLKVVGWIAIVLAAITLLLAVVINLVITDGRLRPIINSYANEYLDADFELGHAEGTLFRTFPRVGVRLENVSIVTNSLHRPSAAFGDTIAGYEIADTLRTKRDTLIAFDEALIGLDVFQYLMDQNNIVLGFIALNNAKVRLYTDERGINNFDLVRPDSPDSLAMEPDTAAADTSSMNISFRHIRLNNTMISYVDRTIGTTVRTDSMNLKIDGFISTDSLNVDVDLTSPKSSFKYDNVRYIRKLPLGLEGKFYYDMTSGQIEMEGSKIHVADIDLDLDGWVHPDDEGADMSLEYGLSTPSVERLFAMIPKDVVSVPVDIKKGSVAWEGSVIGRADTTSLPVIKSHAALDKICAQYEGRPDEIEDLTAEFNLYINKEKADSSFINLDIFHFKGGDSEIEATVKISQLLARAIFDCDIKAHVDLENMQRVLPLDGINMSGITDVDLKTKFTFEDIFNKNYGRITATGSIAVDSLRLSNDSTFNIMICGNMDVKSEEKTALRSTLDIFSLKAPGARVFVKDGKLRAFTILNEDTTVITPLYANLNLSRVFVKSDSIRIFAKNLVFDDKLDPMPSDKTKPMGNHVFTTDTIVASILGNRAFLRGLNATLHNEFETDSTWYLTSTVGFDHLGFKSPSYMLPITSEGLQLGLDGQTVTLDRCNVKVGSTTINATAEMHNVFKLLKRSRDKVEINLNVEADTLNFNRLLAAVVTDTAAVATEDTSLDMDTTAMVATVTTDTLDVKEEDIRMRTQLFLVPKNMCLNAKLRAGAVVFNDLKLTDVATNIRTNEGAVHMTNFLFKMDEARALTTLAYKPWPLLGKAKATLFTHWTKINLETLTSGMGLDTIVPALKPVKGLVDCYMGVEMELDSAMNPNLSTVKASIHLGGMDLTVMDSEQFQKIAKTLRFKNKERNVIDTLSANILMDNSKIQILPFAISMDRYRLAIGGSQDLDMNLNYHVSVLKSPLPFKAGVTITGTPDDFDIDITTAKLKKLVLPDQLAKNDTLAKQMRDLVLYDSYALSGIEPPEGLKAALGDLSQSSSFAIEIQESEATEDELRELEMARRQALEEEAAASADSTGTSATGTDSLATGAADTLATAVADTTSTL